MIAVSVGPIEFLGEEPTHEVGTTEMGGVDGLIQPARAELLAGAVEASGGHVLDGRMVPSEGIGDAAGVLRRQGMRPLSPSEAVTGVEDLGWAVQAAEQGMGADAVVDPVTGRAVSPEINKAGGTVGELSDLKPGG